MQTERALGCELDDMALGQVLIIPMFAVLGPAHRLFPCFCQTGSALGRDSLRTKFTTLCTRLSKQAFGVSLGGIYMRYLGDGILSASLDICPVPKNMVPKHFDLQQHTGRVATQSFLGHPLLPRGA